MLLNVVGKSKIWNLRWRKRQSIKVMLRYDLPFVASVRVNHHQLVNVLMYAALVHASYCLNVGAYIGECSQDSATRK